MAEIASWGQHIFQVTPTMIHSFNKLQVKASAETEDKDSDKQKFVAFKNAKANELSFDITLSKLAGVENVQTDFQSFVDDCRAGTEEFFYMAGEKLFTCKFMLTDVSADSIEISTAGVWITCELKLTFKQSTKYDAADGDSGSDSGGGGGGGGGGGRKRSGTKAKTTADDVDVVSGAARRGTSWIAGTVTTRTSGLQYRVSQVSSKAKASSSKKTTTTKLTTTKRTTTSRKKK